MIKEMCLCSCHQPISGFYVAKCEMCTCYKPSNINLAINTVDEIFAQKPVKPNPTNAQVFKESVLSHIHGINKIINLYDDNPTIKHARTLLNGAYDLIIKGLSANE